MVLFLMTALSVGFLLGGFWLGRDFESKKWAESEEEFFTELMKYRLERMQKEQGRE